MEDYTISEVTSLSDVHAVATVFMKATQTDTFTEMVIRYGDSPPFDAIVKVLTESIENPNHHVFKAVDNATGDVIGMTQWKAPCYVEVEKVDPFAKIQPEVVRDESIAPLPPTLLKLEDAKHQAGVASFIDSRRQIWNAYISNIRGKKHVFLGRLGVHPEYQRKGIGARLMQWGVDYADANGLVAFLNGRPAALKLYESCGFEAVCTTYFEFEDLEVAPVTSMVRKPVLGRKQ